MSMCKSHKAIIISVAIVLLDCVKAVD